MVRPVRLLLALALATASACQCVTVPDRVYRCAEGDVACADAGTTDAGRADAGPTDSGTPDSGAPDAGDAGSNDAGSSCDGGLCRFDDGGWCTSWACVQSLWTPSSQSTNSLGTRGIDLPADVDAGDLYGWFGGVLLPDGRVLAVAHDSDQFLLFDPRTDAITVAARTPRSGRRKYAGGVLAPNGKVFVFPYLERRVLELTVEDGGVREVGVELGPPDGGFAYYVGGVLDAHGFVWTASESHDALPIYRFQADAPANVAIFPAPSGVSGWGGWWGMVRLPDDRLLLLPKEYNPALSPAPVLVTPGPAVGDAGFALVDGFSLTDGGFALQNGSLTPDGVVCATPAGLVAAVLCLRPGDAGTLVPTVHATGPNAFGFNAAFGDGRVWTTPDSSSLMARIASDGGVSTVTATSTRYGYLGLVATPQGLVGIPSGAGTGFMLIQPGSAQNGVYDARPLPVLLSPYFNKL